MITNEGGLPGPIRIRGVVLDEFDRGVLRRGARREPSPGADGPAGLLHLGNFEAWEALLIWEAQLTGVSVESLEEEGLPELLEGEGEGALIFLLGEALVGALATASAADLVGLGGRWADEAEDALDAEVAVGIVDEVAVLARKERQPGERVCCWIS